MYQIEFSGMSVPIYLAVTCKFCVFVNLTQLSLQYLISLVCLLEWFECDGAVWFRRHHSSTGRRTEGHKDVLDCLQGIQGLAMRRQFSIFESNICWNCFLQIVTCYFSRNKNCVLGVQAVGRDSLFSRESRPETKLHIFIGPDSSQIWYHFFDLSLIIPFPILYIELTGGSRVYNSDDRRLKPLFSPWDNPPSCTMFFGSDPLFRVSIQTNEPTILYPTRRSILQTCMGSRPPIAPVISAVNSSSVTWNIATRLRQGELESR